MKQFRTLLAFLLFSCLVPMAGWGQLSITSLPASYTNTFNSFNPSSSANTTSTMNSTGTGSGFASTTTGWTFTNGPANYNNQGTGTGNSGGLYGFGSSSEYSIGALRSGSNECSYTVSLVNNSGSTITSITISWNYEQWRYGGTSNTSGWNCTGTGQLSANATLNAKDFVGASGTAGTTGGLTTPVTSFTLTGLNITHTQTFGITWITTDVAGSDNGVSIDDFTLSATATAPTPTITGAATATAFTTTYGTASAAQTFSVSGSNLTANLVATAPTGFEVSNDGITYGSTATFTQSGGSASGTLRIRLSTTATVGGSYNSQNIVLSSTGATSVNITTAASGNVVTAKALTITGLAGVNRVYNATTTATTTGTAALSGVINSDVVTLGGSPILNFANKNIGTAKPITVTGYSISGAGSGNYTLTQPSPTANITVATLTTSGVSASNKVYDATTAATTSGGSFVGVFGGDVVTLTHSSGIFAQATVGTGIGVTANIAATGTDGANYTVTQPSGLTANITQKPLTITGLTANGKAYDATTTATLSGTAALNGVIAADVSNVTLGGTPVANFNDATVGTGKPVTVTGYTISGSASGNYSLSQPTGLTADITSTPVPVINSTLTQSATYGTTATTYTITATNSPTSFNATGLPAGLSVNTSTGDITGTPTANIGAYNVSITATNAGGTSTAATLVYTITAKTLTISSPAASNKVYDRTNAATITGTLSGIYGADVVTFSGTGTFAQINVGTGIVVTSTNTLGGVGAGNYTLTQPTGLTANITAKALTVSGASVTSKTYTGTNPATITGASLVGVISPDLVTVSGGGSFASVNVGAGISVTASLTLGGANAGNYSITQPTGLTGNITTAALTITGLSGNNKVYDATTTATISGTPSYSGLQNGETFTVSGTASATFANKNVGTAKPITVTGYTAPSSNYSITQPTGLTGNITVATLTISSPGANNKVYTGTNAAVVTGSLSGVFSGDVVTLSGTGTFASVNVGTGISVTSTSTLSNTDAGNYTLTQPTGLTANITQAPLTATADNKTKNEGSVNPALTITYTGFVNSETVAVITAPSISTTAVTASPAGTYPITLTGGSAANYSLTLVNGTLTVNTVVWEDFETGSKTGYSSGSVTCKAGSWTMTNALIGTSGNDKKNGSQAVRIQTSGSIEMNFDITNGISTINVLHQLYGSDGTCTWRLEASTDGGANYTAYVSPTITTSSTTVFTNELFTLNISGTVRFRIVKLSGGTNRINFDDIYYTPYISCTPPSNPSGTISGTTSACDQTTLSFSGTAPSGDVYYWQNSATGQSTTLGNAASDLLVTTSGASNYYVRAYKTATSCWSTNLVGPYAVTILSSSTSIAPSGSQSIQTGNNGSALTVTEGSAATRQWLYTTTPGSGYQSFSPAQTSISYTPNFASANTYYVVCASTYASPCGTVISNEVQIIVTAPGPPTITHTPLSSTNSTSTQTATATIGSTTSVTCATLTYRINGGSWQTPVNGTLSSGTYSFPVPGQVAGTLIEYFITACNASGTVTSPTGVSTSSPYGSFNEYAINCTPASSGTQTIAYQGFEFVGSSGYTFSVDNTNTAPTGAQNYPAHASAVEWNYYNKGANGSLSATNRNSCNCMAESYSGFPAACPDAGNPSYPAGGSTGFCRTFNGNSRGVYLNTSASTENPTGSRSRNGSYSYIQQSRADGGISPLSFIYFDDIAIPDASNATNIKVIAYVSSISTSTLSNGAESADFVELDVKYNSSNSVNTMVPDPTCGSDLYFFSSTTGSSVVGTTNLRWDFAGNTWNTTPAISGTTTKNKITISVPNGTTNVRALIRMLNDDAANSELWAVDDVQVIADYPVSSPSAGRYYRSKQNGKWENISTWESSTTIGGAFSQACEVPTYSNSDSIIIQSGHTVQITANQTADQLRVLAGGKLVLKNVSLIFNDQSNSTDFLVEGTFEDNAASGSGISFNSGAKWKYSTGATIIKTNTSAVTTYRDNYEGGISSIPTNASWYFRYNGGGNPVTTAVGMFYPTLYFENTANTNNFSFNSFSMAFTGSTGGFCTVKGDLNIGTTGTGSVTVYNNNLNSSPMLVNGNINVAANSTLSNQFCPACGSADGTSTGDGTGFEVKGNVTVNGSFDVYSSTNSAKGTLKFSGTGTQTVSGSGTFDLYNIALDKTAQTIVDQQVDLTVANNLNFTGGILKTNANTMYVSNTSTSAITGGNTSGTDKYVQGRLKRKTDGASTYTFPIGHSAQNAQGFTITPTGTSGSDLLGYLETNSTSPVKTVAYCDLETKTAAGQQIGQGSAGADGALDQVVFNLASPLQWDITNPGGGVSSYNVTVMGNGGQDISPVTSAGGTAIRYLLKNGEPGNTGFATGSGGADYPTVGFLACPNQYTLTGMTSFSKFTLNGANPSGTGLPVKLLFFTGKKVENYSQLDWATAIEIDNEKFVVERSADAVQFEAIGSVKGAGNTTVQQNYQWLDKSPLSGWNYYRLKQVDFDGDVEYTNTVAVNFDGDETTPSIIVFPSPSKDFINVQILGSNQIVEAVLYNMIGQAVKNVTPNERMSIEDLPSGEYFIKVIMGNNVVVKQFVKE